MAAIAKDDLAQAWRAADNAFIEMTTIRAVIDTLNMPGTGEHEVLGARYLRHTKSIVVRERTRSNRLCRTSATPGTDSVFWPWPGWSKARLTCGARPAERIQPEPPNSGRANATPGS